jgi:hypothetical protein
MKKTDNKNYSPPYKFRKTVQHSEAMKEEVKKRTSRVKEIGEFKNRPDVNIILTNK